jgi:hypothetical protein
MLEVLIFCPMDHGVFISFKTLVFPLFFKLDLSILFVCFVFGGTGVWIQGVGLQSKGTLPLESILVWLFWK